MNVGILGSGTWGKALATIVAEAGNQPRIGYRGKPPGGYPGSPNLRGLAAESDLLLVAEPVGRIREVIREARPGPDAKVVVATRGLCPDEGDWLSDIVLKESACLRVGALAGPAVASEVLKHRPSAMVVASAFDEVCELTQDALHSPICRIYTSRDLRGVELAGAMVMVLSVAVGVADSLNLGVGIRGVIVTRGIAEATRLGQAVGADPATFAGLSGVGDLVSCASHPDHPGYAAGLRLGRGSGVDKRFVEEAHGAVKLAKRVGVELPLTEAVAAIASGQVSARLAIDGLMRRDPTSE